MRIRCCSFVNCYLLLVDAAEWWSNHGSSAPNLRVLAMRILSLTCSSSACERNWSAFEEVTNYMFAVYTIGFSVSYICYKYLIFMNF